jgi:hypothetical protein
LIISSLNMVATNTNSHDGVKIIHAGLFRMGTYSMAKAYTILGIKTFHALDEPMSANWALLEQAAEGKWPNAPKARRRPPFTRDDWDKLWGDQYDAVCDTAAPFTLDLFKAYPKAKVVIVQRNFDSWWPSFQTEILDKLFVPLFEFQIFLAWHLLGFRAGQAMRKLIFGFFNATTKAEVEAHGRQTYDKFFHDIRATVPPDQLLEYKLADGWGPLCEFLGKDVPDVSFPRANDRNAHSESVDSRKKNILFAMSKTVVLGGLGLVTLGAIGWLFS